MNANQVNTIIKAPCSLKHFFHLWVKFLTPVAKLSKREQQVLGLLLYLRHTYSDKVTDSDCLDKVIFSTDTLKKVAAEANTTIYNIRVFVANLRRKGIIQKNSIHPRFIPKIVNNHLLLGVYFEIRDIQAESDESKG